jgi:hypothetical protein
LIVESAFLVVGIVLLTIRIGISLNVMIYLIDVEINQDNGIVNNVEWMISAGG